MNWKDKLLDARDLNDKHFTKGAEYEVSDSCSNETYSHHGKPVVMLGLPGTNLVVVLADDLGERCTVCRYRFEHAGTVQVAQEMANEAEGLD